MDGCTILICSGALPPREPNLHGMLETQLSWDLIDQQSGLSHQQADHVIGQEVNPKLLDHHLRVLAAQPLHTERGLDVSQIQFDVPTA